MSGPLDEERIQKGIEVDGENPEWTDEMFKKAKKRRGRPKLAYPKELVSLRLDHDVLEHFRSNGKGWQSEINEVLATHVKKRSD